MNNQTVKKLLLFCALWPLVTLAQTVTDEQYEAANASIEAEATYRIFTFNNGTREGATKYYLTDDGWLHTDVQRAGRFVFHRIEGDNLFRSPGW